MMENKAVAGASRRERTAAYHRRTRRQRWIEGIAIVAFWSVITLLLIAHRAIDPHFGEPGRLLPGEALHAFLLHALWAALTPIIFWLSRRFSFEHGNWRRHLVLHAFLALAVAAVINTLGSGLFHLLVETGKPHSFSLMRSLLGLRFLVELIVYLVVLGAGFARDYFLRYRDHLEEAAELRAHAAELRSHAAELQAQLSDARLHALRMQINPHFLFNTLHTISTYLERDPRGVRRMIARLSELLRYTLEMGNVKEVPLRQELNFLDGYLEIQSIRFQDMLEVHREVAPDVLEALVPNLILQPLVENAIQHGVGDMETGGRIEIRAWREAEYLHLSVRDNGPGLSEPGGDGEAAAPRGIGLRNTRERLESLYGEAQRLILQPVEGGGLEAHICLPYHVASDLYTSVASLQ